MPFTVLVLARSADAVAQTNYPPHLLLLQATPGAYRYGSPAFDMLALNDFDVQTSALDWQHAAEARGLVALTARAHTVVDSAPPSNGFCHVELLVRRAGLTPADFAAYSRKTHGPIAARMPGVRRYQQFAALEHGAYTFDGIALLWFDSMNALRENASHPAFTEAREDIPRFMDMAQSRSVLAQQRIA